MMNIFLKYLTKWLLPDIDKDVKEMELRVDITGCPATGYICKLDLVSLIESETVTKQMQAIKSLVQET